jgi:transposase
MRQKQDAKSGSAEKTVRDIRRATRRRHSSEEKNRIVLEGRAARTRSRNYAVVRG